MTDIDARPQLEELLAILHGIVRIEADVRAQQPEQKQFTVAITFDREKLRGMGAIGWAEDALPRPTRLFEGILEQLQAWLQQRFKEERWARGESRYGASIDSHIAFLTEALKAAKARSDQAPNNLKDAMDCKCYAGCILRLQELKERRAAGAIRNEWEDMREKARRSWEEEEFEAPKREEEQRRQRERRAGPDFTYADTGFQKKAYDKFYSFFHGHRTPKAKASGKRPWHEVLDVPVSADKETINKAYRRLASKYHPDRYKEADRDERMTEINTSRDEGLGGLSS